MATFHYYADGYSLGSGKHLNRREAEAAARKLAERSPWGARNVGVVGDVVPTPVQPIADGYGRRAPF